MQSKRQEVGAAERAGGAVAVPVQRRSLLKCLCIHPMLILPLSVLDFLRTESLRFTAMFVRGRCVFAC